jgi:SAM-dependent methyltransferase
MDVVELRDFYASRLGLASRRLIAHRLRRRWSSLGGATVMGLGFATPYLESWRAESARSFGFMMARQGVIHWPQEGDSATALVDEFDLPLLESTIDFALIIHGLELTDNPEEMLQEVWRVMAPQGRLMLIVPNRRGMWARFDSTPFGYGQPFSRPQLGKLLKEARFTAVAWSQALFMPPFEKSMILNSAPAWERLGSWLSPAFSGVIIVEAVKQVYAIPPGKRARRLVPRLRPALSPHPASSPPLKGIR